MRTLIVNAPLALGPPRPSGGAIVKPAQRADHPRKKETGNGY